MTARSEKFAPYSAWLAVCFFWGTTYLAIRIALETLPPMLLAGMRFVAAGAALFAFMRFWRGERLPRGKEWLQNAALGLMLLGFGNGFVVWAEQWIASGMAALMIATSPFWMAGLERARADGERAGGRGVAGMLLGFGGLLVLVAPDLFGRSLSTPYLLGIVAIQIACASWSIGSVYSKHHPTSVAPLMTAAVQMLFAGVAFTLAGTLTGEWNRMVAVSARSLAAVAYLAVFGSIVAFGAYTYAIQKLPLSLVSTYSYINPVIAMLLGWLMLGETLGWRVWLAMAIILGGVALVKTAPKPSSKTTMLTQTVSNDSMKRADVAPPASETCPAGTNIAGRL